MGIQPRCHQRLHTNAISFRLVAAAVAQCGVLCRCLCGRQCCHSGVTTGCSEQHKTRQHGGQVQGLLIALKLNPPRKMALAQVGNFVGQHRGQFVFCLGVHQQAVVHPDDAARYRKGVDGGVVDQHKVNAPILQLAVYHQAVNEVLQVIEEQRVVHGGRLAAKDFQPGSTQLVFVLRGKQAGAGLAQIRQLEPFHSLHRCQRQHRHQQGSAQVPGFEDLEQHTLNTYHV